MLKYNKAKHGKSGDRGYILLRQPLLIFHVCIEDYSGLGKRMEEHKVTEADSKCAAPVCIPLFSKAALGGEK